MLTDRSGTRENPSLNKEIVQTMKSLVNFYWHNLLPSLIVVLTEVPQGKGEVTPL